MRRVNMRESLRGAMAAGSMMSVATQVATLVEAAVQECVGMVACVGDRVLELQERQVIYIPHPSHIYYTFDFARSPPPSDPPPLPPQDDLFRNFNRVVDALKRSGGSGGGSSGGMKALAAAAPPPLSGAAAKLAKVAGVCDSVRVLRQHC